MANKAAFGVIEIGSGPTVIGQLRSWRQTEEATEIDTTVMGTGKASMIPGTIRDGVECDLFFEYADAGQALILTNVGQEATQTISIYPRGVGSGNERWSAECYVMRRENNAAADGALEMTATFSTDSAGGAWSVQP